MTRSGKLILFLSLLVALSAAALLAYSVYEGSKPIEQSQRATMTGRSLPALPTVGLPGAVEPEEELLDVTPQTAQEINESRPFITGEIPAALPFRSKLAGKERERAIACLATAGLYEAGSRSGDQSAVMQVVLNRVRHPAFPDTICGVVFQGSERSTGCQFSFTCDGSMRRRQPSPAAWRSAQGLATAMMEDTIDERVGLATHFHTDWVVPYWSDSLDKLTNVRTHLFFRWRGFWGTAQALAARYRGARHSRFGQPLRFARTGRSRGGERDARRRNRGRSGWVAAGKRQHRRISRTCGPRRLARASPARIGGRDGPRTLVDRCRGPVQGEAGLQGRGMERSGQGPANSDTCPPFRIAARSRLRPDFPRSHPASLLGLLTLGSRLHQPLPWQRRFYRGAAGGVSASGMDRFPIGAIQTDAGQTLAGIGARVDRYPVRMVFDLVDDRMAVDDHGTVIAIGLREIVPDEHQVLFSLPVEGHAGPDAGMHEEIVTVPIGKGRIAEHGDKMIRHCRAEAIAEVETVFVGPRRLDAETFEEGEPAVLEPDILRHRMPAEAVEQQILMVAFQQPDARFGHQLVGQIEAGGAMRTTIDDIAEQDELDRFEIAWPVFPVRGDFLHQRTEQIVTTVNVSDSVDALASSRAGLASVFAKEPQHSAIMAQGLQNVR